MFTADVMFKLKEKATRAKELFVFIDRMSKANPLLDNVYVQMTVGRRGESLLDDYDLRHVIDLGRLKAIEDAEGELACIFGIDKDKADGGRVVNLE